MTLDNQTIHIIAIAISLSLGLCWSITLILLHGKKKQNLTQSFQLQQQQRDLEYQDQTIQQLHDEKTTLLVENKESNAQLAGLRASLEEKKIQADNFQLLLNSTQKQMGRDFQLMAEKIFNDKNQALNTQNKSGLEAILKPVQEQITDFKRKIEDVYDKESRDRISLTKEIEHLKILNKQISDDAVNLTNALKGRNKLQGFWGEMILENLLEDSGLRPNHEYTVQKGLKDEHGKEMRPDVIIRLPGKRHLVIDAKVSIKAFEKACKEDNREKRQQLLHRHLESIKKHAAVLAGKNYHRLNGVNSPDFVLLFMPVESAFQAALSLDSELTTWASRKKIILTSPSTLLAILRTINHLWRLDKQDRNAQLIAKQAGSLYDKFIGFLEVFEEIGYRLDQSHNSWKIARKRLKTGRGNVIDKAETLKTLGVQTEKSIPESFFSLEDSLTKQTTPDYHKDEPRNHKISNLIQN